jgi:hypothetical protein
MFFKKLVNGEISFGLITEENLRYVFNSVNFDEVGDNPVFFENLGYAIIRIADQPVITPYQYLEETAVKLEDSSWQQVWNVIEKSVAEKKSIHDKKAAEIAYIKENKLMFVNDFINGPEYVDVLDILHAYKAQLEAIDPDDAYDVVWPAEPDPDTGIMLPF